MARFSGIYCPNIVPFHEDGAINEEELRRIVEWLIGKGIHGLYPNGSTGEFARLSFEERIRVVEIIADQNHGRVPILAGAAENNIDLVVAAAKRYADLGVSAISVTGPYFYKVSGEGVEAYFREVARRSPVDILLYNIPQFANEIPVEVIMRLAMDCPNIVGTKDSSRDMPRFVQTINRLRSGRPDFSLLIGCEEILFPSLIMGADGGTLASSGVVPESIVKIYEDFRAGNYDECRRIQLKVLDLIEVMLKTGNFPEGFRSGVALRGFQPGPPRQPFGPGEEAFLAEMRSRTACLLQECGFDEAAAFCKPSTTGRAASPASRIEVETIVRKVLKNLNV
jgi:dihydrodipicolinate synthase/N-acetylneuraminate lyase